MPDGVLHLDIVNVYGEYVDEAVDIFLRHQTLSHNVAIRGRKVSRTLKIPGLHQVPQGLYRMEIDAPSYLAVSQFVNILSSGATRKLIRLPVDHNKVVGVGFPAYDTLGDDAKRLLDSSNAVLGFAGKKGSELYAAVDHIRKAGFLNLVAKAHRTRLTNSRTVLSYVEILQELRGDRFFAAVPPEFRSEVKNSVNDQLFHPADDSLHHPQPGFQRMGSFKTWDHYGNLQLTFFSNGTTWDLDMDIDDAQGLDHVFQVLRNTVTGQPTHPYDIHEILIAFQELDPGYKLIVKTEAQAAGVSG